MPIAWHHLVLLARSDTWILQAMATKIFMFAMEHNGILSKSQIQAQVAPAPDKLFTTEPLIGWKFALLLELPLTTGFISKAQPRALLVPPQMKEKYNTNQRKAVFLFVRTQVIIMPEIYPVS